MLPVWFKAEAAEICRNTLEKGGGKPLVQQIADLRDAFSRLGVTAEMLERKRSRKIGDFTPEDIGGLRVVYGSLKREETTLDDEFPAPASAPAPVDAFTAAADGGTATVIENAPAMAAG